MFSNPERTCWANPSWERVEGVECSVARHTPTSPGRSAVRCWTLRRRIILGTLIAEGQLVRCNLFPPAGGAVSEASWSLQGFPCVPIRVPRYRESPLEVFPLGTWMPGGSELVTFCSTPAQHVLRSAGLPVGSSSAMSAEGRQPVEAMSGLEGLSSTTFLEGPVATRTALREGRRYHVSGAPCIQHRGPHRFAVSTCD